MPHPAPKAPNHHARHLVKETWEAQANLSFFLGLLVVCVFVLPLTSIVEHHLNVYGDIAYSLVLISGMAIGWGQSHLFHVGAVIGVAGLALRWLSWRSPIASTLREPVTLAAILVLIIILLVKVFQRGPVSGSRLQGAMAAYLLLGLGWAHAYAIFNRHDPNSFVMTDSAPTTVGAWTYFSFITLTTVGYGDIIPKAPVARMLAMGEALTGQLYLAVLVARLVALQVSAGVAAREDKNE
jgi:Ion channel